MTRKFVLALGLVMLPAVMVSGQGRARWSEQQANDWYARQPWLVGANFIPCGPPSTNCEMFQAATFNPALNDKELGLGESIGMNTMRVFLQDQLWTQDPEGFKKRLDTFLTIARNTTSGRCSCSSTPVGRPIRASARSTRQSPASTTPDGSRAPESESCSTPPMSPNCRRTWKASSAPSPRTTAFSAGTSGMSPTTEAAIAEADTPAKVRRVNELLPKAFAWARAANPSQPLTSGVWTGNWSDPAKETITTKIQLAESDVISFHNYGWPEVFEARIKELQPQHRPIICTEYMARGAGSTFDGSLPIAKKYNVGAINWGLVAGKTQTYYPWDSWDRPYVRQQPTIWFHEVFRQDDTPYRQRRSRPDPPAYRTRHPHIRHDSTF